MTLDGIISFTEASGLTTDSNALKEAFKNLNKEHHSFDGNEDWMLYPGDENTNLKGKKRKLEMLRSYLASVKLSQIHAILAANPVYILRTGDKIIGASTTLEDNTEFFGNLVFASEEAAKKHYEKYKTEIDGNFGGAAEVARVPFFAISSTLLNDYFENMREAAQRPQWTPFPTPGYILVYLDDEGQEQSELILAAYMNLIYPASLVGALDHATADLILSEGFEYLYGDDDDEDEDEDDDEDCFEVDTRPKPHREREVGKA